MLERIRAALGSEGAIPTVPRAYRHGGHREQGDSDRFCERVADYGASVMRVDPADIEQALSERAAARTIQRVVAAAGLDWALPGVMVERDHEALLPVDLTAFDGALTGCALAIAETGTIVLDGSPACGRRALQLVPDHHLCVVHADQIVAGVPEAIAGLSDAASKGRPITFISGPSATSDIEFERVEGVHGPRGLDVILVSPESAQERTCRAIRR
jgi:L-lactate dehydrogenase complex protein LldG